MLRFIRSLFAPGTPEQDLPAVPPGQRVYAIGDVHGRLDLFEVMVAAIEEDDEAGGVADTTVILLGDLVDRGPDSAGVLRAAREWQQQRKVRILAGNHEEMFLNSFDNAEMLRHFLRHGGKQTILSFGVPRRILASTDLAEIQEAMRSHVPQADRDYMATFEDMIRIGDYVFVHAGIDPAVPLAEQRRSDLRWIREPFLSHAEAHGPVIVHGHTISEEPEDRGNRIGIDTGAYGSGRLTALVLEGTRRRYIEAVAVEGKVGAAPRAIG
ncbi:serine/threonine protein phosphatase [Altererythrobacter sp. KTW20L]|uniref:metallophosphoesterase family protein n=1 Tax=Altererythrobacter sp. KTW20L TaxID=2942210 RepID=UPI0020BEA423|nr:metallophosphoesterase family protein [Altererythrobacter sp. KTW20L]MCL6250924.1 serine/threonine protein phosphatase [Altererythrobacter sp. KTW20L]